jgi:hypothetical protein
MKSLLLLLFVTVWSDQNYPNFIELSPTTKVYASAKTQADSLKFTVVKAYTLQLVDTNWNAIKDTEYILRGTDHITFRNTPPSGRVQFVYDYISTRL